MSSLEKYLSEHGRVISANMGVSMLPLLRQGKDLFFLEKKGAKRCKVGDVVLYRRKRQYVLHRVVEVREKDYVILGDNCTFKEYGIQDGDILAVMTSFIRNGREHSVNEIAYRIYLFVCLRTASIRIYLRQKTENNPKDKKADMAMKIAETVIYLASCAVNGTKPDTDKLAGMNFDSLLSFASYHMLRAVVAMALESAGFRDVRLKNAISFSVRKATFFEAANSSVLKSLEEAGIWYMPLKGAVLKNYYPHFGMREMSDYDILAEELDYAHCLVFMCS